MVETTPLVTIAVPTYNGAKYLAECLSSACNQSYPHLEIIVLDDRSTDATLEIAESFASADSRVRVVKNGKRLGLADNFTACAVEARGTWVKYLLQDDTLDHTCVEEMVAATSFGCPFIVCGRRYLYDGVDEARREAAEGTLRVSIARELSLPGYLSAAEFSRLALKHLSINFVGEPVAVMIDRDVARRDGTYDRRFLQIVDLECYVRLGTAYGATIVPQPLVSFRVHPAQATATHLAQRRLHTTVFDEVLYMANLAYSPRYLELRRIGLRQEPPVDLESLARGRIVGTWRAKGQFSRSGWDTREARALWNDVIVGDPVVGPRVSSSGLRRESLVGRLAEVRPRGEVTVARALSKGPTRGRAAVGRALRVVPRGDEMVNRLHDWRRRGKASREAPSGS